MRVLVNVLVGLMVLALTVGEARAICFFSCDPSEANARTVVENQMRARFPTAQFKISSFRKTDGRKINFAGMEAYQLFYSATFEFPNGFASRDASIMEKTNIQSQLMRLVSVGGYRLTKGDMIWDYTVLEAHSSTVFEKSEKGWRGEDGLVY